MMQKIKQKYRYSVILLRELVITDFKLRYQGSFLGYIWSLLRPLMLFVILYLVFVEFLKVGKDIPHFPVYLLLGIVMWNYFSEVTNTGVEAIVGRGDLIRKLNFPKYVIVLAGSVSALINLTLNFVVVGFFMWIDGVSITWSILWLPFIVLELFALAIGMAFLLSTVFVKLRDVNYIWEVIMQAAFYATPIIYPMSLLTHTQAAALILNPMAQIIQDARHVAITPAAETVGTIYSNDWWRLIPVGIVVAVALGGALYFRSRAKYFAEDV